MGSWDDIEPENTSLPDDPSPSPPPTRSQKVRINEAAIESLTHRMAALQVRRQCNQRDHRCKPSQHGGQCPHPNHRRDAELLLPEMLAILDLPLDLPTVTEGERIGYLSSLKDVTKPVSLDDLEE